MSVWSAGSCEFLSEVGGSRPDSGSMHDLPDDAVLSQFPEFTTERLHLCRPTSDDVALLVGLDADSTVMRFITGGKPSSEAEIIEGLTDSHRHVWLATALVGGGFVGWFSLRQSGPRELEIGYRLTQSWWGRGLATEGSARLLALAFEEMQVTRVWAQTMTANTRSRAVMERLGMRFVRNFFIEGLETIEGSELGDVEYEITADDWLLGRQLSHDEGAVYPPDIAPRGS